MDRAIQQPRCCRPALGGDEYLNACFAQTRRLFNEHVHIRPLSRPLGPLSNLVPTPTWNAHLEKIAAESRFSRLGRP